MTQPYYADESVTIYHGDCRGILPSLEKVDLVLTDPPYNIVATGGGRGIGAKRQYLSDIVGFTDSGFDVDLLKPYENWMCFCGKDQLVGLIQAAQAWGRRWMLVTWNKPNPTPLVNGNYLPDTEYVIHAFPPNGLHGEYHDRSRFIVHPAEQNDIPHPNVKPLRVMRRLVRTGSAEGDTVLDPFMGSGTTIRAAKDLGRRAIGIEIEERYCEIAANRCRQMVLL